MEEIRARDVVEYGVELCPYVFAVQILAVLPFLVGFGMLQNGDQLGLVVLLAGGVTSTAGLLAVVRKVVADGVAAGRPTDRGAEAGGAGADSTSVPNATAKSGK